MKEKLRIFVVCSYALSSSLIVEKMQEISKEKGISIESQYMSPEKLKENLGKCDVVLLSPQVRFSKSVFQELLNPFGVPVIEIPMQMYGLVDAEKAIDLAFRSVKNWAKKGGEKKE